MIWSYQESVDNWNIWRPPSFPKTCTTSIFFCSPLLHCPDSDHDREREFKLTKPAPFSCWQKEGTGAEKGSFINVTVESSGDSLPLSLYQEGQKTRREHFFWKLVICRRQQQTTETEHKTRPITTWCLSNDHHFLNPVFLKLSILHITTQENSFAFRLFFPPTLSTCTEGISWVIKIILGCDSSSCMILLIKYLN